MKSLSRVLNVRARLAGRAFLAPLALLISSVSAYAAVGIMDQQQTSTGFPNFYIDGTGATGARQVSQTFVPAISGALTEVRLLMNPSSATITLRITDTPLSLSGFGSNAVFANSALATTTISGTSGGWQSFTFTSPAVLTAGHQYGFVLSSSGVASFPGSFSNPYSRGNIWWSDNSPNPGIDMAFQTLVAPIVIAIDQQQTSSNFSTFYIDGTGQTGARQVSQSFIPGVTGNLTEVRLLMAPGSSPVTMTIVATPLSVSGFGGNAVFSNPALASVTVPAPTSAGWVTFSFNSLPPLNADTQYAFVLSSPGVATFSGSFSNPYRGGSIWWSDNAPNPSIDATFQTVMETFGDTTAPVVTAPTNVSAEATGTLTSVAIGTATATDYVGVVSISNNAPAKFPVGTTAVTWSAADASGNIGTALQIVTVRDTTAPAVTAPPAVVVEATGVTTSAAIGNAVATDAVGVVSITNNAPAQFPFGVTTVTWTARDAAGNAGHATQVVTVRDTTAPAITAPSDVVVEATGLLTSAPIGNASATDAVGVVSITNNAPAQFPVGVTTVTWTARDASNHAATATQTVTVHDSAAPVVTAPASVVVEATGSLTSAVIGTATATDAVGVVTLGNNAPAQFPAGVTTVTWTARDAAGNAGTATQTVTVQDTTAPAVIAPADKVVEATGPQTAVNVGNATATDVVGVASLSSDAPAQFPVGTTTVTWTATDAAGNAATAIQKITVKDTTAPVATAAPDKSVEAGGVLTSVSIGSATATDAVGVVSITSNAPAQFPVGTTTVTWTARDAAGNTGTAIQTIIVKDSTPPVITAPSDQAAEATGSLTSVTIGSATAIDAVGVISITNDAPAQFPVGTTTVTWIARDASGNFAAAIQHITVTDTTAPVVTAPTSLGFEATGVLTAASSGTATATDAVGVVAITSDAPAQFPIGTTTITWTATDAAGNAGTATQTVRIIDTTAPVITAPANVTVDSTSSTGATVPYAATATDLVDGLVIVNGSPTSGSTFPIGVTTVALTATDAAGNTGTASFTVTVLSPMQQVSNVIAAVANSPILSPSEANSLGSKLDAASKSLASGKTTAAKGQLGAGVNQLNALVKSGRATAAQVQPLVDALNRVIGQI